MENLILTPLQLWADYKENSNLRINFIKYEQKQGLFYFEAYINGEEYDDNFVRIFTKGYVYDHNNSHTLTIVGDYYENVADELMLKYVDMGYNVITFDYCGQTNNSQHYTIYPPQVEYGNIDKAGEHLNFAKPSAKDTCVFLWTKVCKQVIAFVEQICGKNNKIALMGIKNGCDITWQTSAIDSRVDGLINIINAGWKEYGWLPKFGDGDDLKFDEERERWFLGSASQTYAKFIKCPTLFVGASNNAHTSIDRIENTLKIMSESQVTTDFCAGYSDSVDSYAQNLIELWLNKLANNEKMPECPTITIKEKSGAVGIECEFDNKSDITEVQLYYCFDELISSVRSWKYESIMLANPNIDLQVTDKNSYVFAFVRVFYKGGWTISSLQSYMDLDAIKNKVVDKQTHNHIIYGRKNGIKPWIKESNNTFQNASPIMKEGAYDIIGISCPKGNLSTYAIGDSSKYCENDKILQLDIYSPIVDTCQIILTVVENNTIAKYESIVDTKGQDWSKISLNLQDFKSADKLPLKSWQNVKKLTIINPKDKVFNNLIWV